MKHIARYMAVFTIAAGLTACAGQTKPTGGAAMDFHPAGAVTATQLLPPQSREATFAWTDGPAQGQTCGLQFEPSDAGAFIATLEDQNVSRLEQMGGAWLLTGEDDLDEQVTITYDPPLLVLPAEMKVGEPFATECNMTVRNLDSGAPRDRGTCAVEIELLGRRTIDVAGVAAEVFVVRSTRRLDLKLADVTVTITTSYQPQVGVVAEHVHRHVKAIGLFERTVEEARVVIAP